MTLLGNRATLLATCEIAETKIVAWDVEPPSADDKHNQPRVHMAFDGWAIDPEGSPRSMLDLDTGGLRNLADLFGELLAP